MYKITELKIECVVVFNSELNSALVEKAACSIVKSNYEKIKKAYTEIHVGKTISSEMEILSIARICVDLYMGSAENVVNFKGDVEAGFVRAAEKFNKTVIEEMIKKKCLESDTIQANKARSIRQVRIEYDGRTIIRGIHIPNKNDIRALIDQSYR